MSTYPAGNSGSFARSAFFASQHPFNCLLNSPDRELKSKAQALKKIFFTNFYNPNNKNDTSSYSLFSLDQLNSFVEQGFHLRDDFEDIIAGYQHLLETYPAQVFEDVFIEREITEREVTSMSRYGKMAKMNTHSSQFRPATEPLQPSQIICDTGGLPNVGNSCWLNASIQLLFAKETTLRTFLQTQAKLYEDAQKVSCREIEIDPAYFGSSSQDAAILADQKRKLLAQTRRCSCLNEILTLKDQTRNPEKLEHLKTLIRDFNRDFMLSNPSLTEDRQEDAHEGMLSLLKYLGLEEELSFSQTTRIFGHDSRRSRFTKPEVRTTYELRCGEILSTPHLRSYYPEYKDLQTYLNLSLVMKEALSGDNAPTRPDNPELTETASREVFIPEMTFNSDSFMVLVERNIFNPQTQIASRSDLPFELNTRVILPLHDNERDYEVSKIAELILATCVVHVPAVLEGPVSGHYKCYALNDGSATLYDDDRVEIVLDSQVVAADIAHNGYLAHYKVDCIREPSDQERTYYNSRIDPPPTS